MRAIIISIGDELLNGSTINTNASWIASHIQTLGIDIYEIITISDIQEHILASLNHCSEHADIIFITGGLGPTKDDITKDALCKFFNSELVFHESLYLKLKQAFEKRNLIFTEINKSQAMYPHNCKIIKNSQGSAQGMWFTKNNVHVISMPGVPFEMKAIMTEEIIPRIIHEFHLPIILNNYLMSSGTGESIIAEMISQIEEALPKHISLAYLPSPCVVKLRLTGRGNDKIELQQELDIYTSQMKQALGEIVYAETPEPLEAAIGKLLLKLNATLCTAESCTGGNIGHKIVNIAGSSQYYLGSFITYSYELKEHLLGVKNETLNNYGAVSEQTVSEMLDGVLNATKSDYAIAVSGIAGPDGGTHEKPVGTVYIGVAGRDKKIIKKHFFTKTRELNIEYASLYALHELRLLLNSSLEKKRN